MAVYSLSKSTYIRGLQCLKSLYLNKHRTFLRDRITEDQLAKFARGHAVGKMAQQLFPGGVEMPKPDKTSAARTRQWIAEGVPVIYEACFIHQGVIVALDILVKQPEGWNAYEIKSSTALSEVFYQDAFLQSYVIRGTGLSLKHFYLVHRKPEPLSEDTASLSESFIFTEIEFTGEARDLAISQQIRNMQEVLQYSHSPDVQPGKHCMTPYPCDFRGFCWKGLTAGQRNQLLNPDNP